MKRPLRQPFLATVIFFFLAAGLASALDVPPLRGRVNDYAGVMSQEQARTMESQLAQFEQDTGHQVAVLTIPTLDGEDIEGFSIRVAESWKIGKKGFDNGVILVVAVKDRRLRLEVGYGLEGVLPDAIAKTITSDYIVPRFRSQDYAGGIIAGIDAVLKVIKKEPLPESARKKGGRSGIRAEFHRHVRDHLGGVWIDGIRVHGQSPQKQYVGDARQTSRADHLRSRRFRRWRLFRRRRFWRRIRRRRI